MSSDTTQNSIYRILDAGINRAGEGLRVVEDYSRMVLGDAHLSRKLKELRHDLTSAVSMIDPAALVAARDSESDVGRHIQVDSEYDRGKISSASSISLVQANLARVQQSFRSIEEFSKTINVELAKTIEQLRYRTYTLEKAILTTVISLQNLNAANLYVLIPAVGESADLQLVQQLVDAKVGLIQLREKRLTDRQLVAAGKSITAITRGSETRFLMNDRVDLTLATGADGVHLGQDDLAVADARRMLGAAKLIGVSTHSIEQARAAVLDGANYIGVGPVFSSTTKSFDDHVGLELVRQVAEEIQLPAFAIGGIGLGNVSQVVEAGLHRVAVSAAVVQASRPQFAAEELMQRLHHVA